MARSAQELTALTQHFVGDPQVQDLLRQWADFHARTGVWSDRRGPSTYETALRQRMAAQGISDVRIDFSGPDGAPILKNRGLESWAYPLIIGGAAFGGLAAAGAFAPAAAAAGGGAGAAGGGAGAGAGGGAAAGGVLPATSLATGAPGIGLGYGAIPLAPAPASWSAATAAGAGAAGGGAGVAGAAGGAGGGLGGFFGSDLGKLALLGGATDVVGSILQSRAAGKAAQQQQAAIERALATTTPLYERSRADLMPYAQAGGQGLTALTSLLGLPAAPVAAAPAAVPLAALGAGASTPTHPRLPTSTPVPGRAVPRAAGGTVLLRAPNGQTQQVPAEQAAFYLARGATRV